MDENSQQAISEIQPATTGQGKFPLRSKMVFELHIEIESLGLSGKNSTPTKKGSNANRHWSKDDIISELF